MSFSLRVSRMLHSSLEAILLEGSRSSMLLTRSVRSFVNLVFCSGNLTFAFICASFSPGLKGDLKYMSVYTIQPSAQISTLSVIGKPENKSSYSGALYNGVVVFSISSPINSLFYIYSFISLIVTIFVMSEC